jgi:hypothetical protein
MKTFNRENWQAAKERLTYFLKELADEGYPDDLIADVTIMAGVFLVDQVYGRDALVTHLARLALKASDPNDDLSTSSRFLQ